MFSCKHLAFFLLITQPIAAHAVECADTISLIRLWSPSRGDNFTTTDGQWIIPQGQPPRGPDYSTVSYSDGYVFKQRKPGTVPLYSWYSSSRGDNFITSDPQWAGRSGDTKDPDYTFVRIEGYIHDPRLPKPANTIPLSSFWSPSREDNFATSDPSWAGRVGDARSPDYKLYRIEGYVHRNCDNPLLQ